MSKERRPNSATRAGHQQAANHSRYAPQNPNRGLASPYLAPNLAGNNNLQQRPETAQGNRRTTHWPYPVMTNTVPYNAHLSTPADTQSNYLLHPGHFVQLRNIHPQALPNQYHQVNTANMHRPPILNHLQNRQITQPVGLNLSSSQNFNPTRKTRTTTGPPQDTTNFNRNSYTETCQPKGSLPQLGISHGLQQYFMRQQQLSLAQYSNQPLVHQFSVYQGNIPSTHTMQQQTDNRTKSHNSSSKAHTSVGLLHQQRNPQTGNIHPPASDKHQRANFDFFIKSITQDAEKRVPTLKRKATDSSANETDSRHGSRKRQRMNEINTSPGKTESVSTTKHSRKTRNILKPELQSQTDKLTKMRDYKRKKRTEATFRAAENEERKTRHQKSAADHASQAMSNLIAHFQALTARGPTYICVCCDRMCYRHAVLRADKTLALDTDIIRKCAIGTASAERERWLCFSCSNALKNDRMPAMALVNGNKFPDKPSHLKLHKLEWRLLAPRLVFMKIHRAPRGNQLKIEGNVVNVIANIANCVNSLPRMDNNSATIPAKLKRRVTYKSYTISQNIRPNKVKKAAVWLTKNGPLYRDQEIKFNSKWVKRYQKVRRRQVKEMKRREARNSGLTEPTTTPGTSVTHMYWCEFTDCYFYSDSIESAQSHLKCEHNAIDSAAGESINSSCSLVTFLKQRQKRENELAYNWCSLCGSLLSAGQTPLHHMALTHNIQSLQQAKTENQDSAHEVWAFIEIKSEHVTRMRPNLTPEGVQPSSKPRRKIPLSILEVIRLPSLLGKIENENSHKEGSDTASTEIKAKLTSNKSSDTESENEEDTAGATDTMLSQNTYIENTEFGAIHNFAPGAGNKPKSIFLDKYCEELAYPDIFLGHKRLDTSKRNVFISYGDIVKSELLQTDRRAATNVENIFFKTKKLQMKLLTGRTQLALRQHKTKDQTITAGDIKEGSNVKKIIQFDHGYKFLATLRGSPPYFEKAKKDIFAMIRQLGPATFFISLSAAETRWHHLLRILGQTVDNKCYTDQEIEKLSWPHKSRLIQTDPITCARHFDHTLRAFITNFLKSPQAPIGKLLDFFYRVEMQHRGSCHVHMLVWIEHAPLLEKNDLKDIISFIDKYITCHSPPDPKSEMSQMVDRQKHTHTLTCRPQKNSKCRFSYPQPPLPETHILEPLTNSDDNYTTHLAVWKRVQEEMEELDKTVAVPFKDFLAKIGVTKDEYIFSLRAGIKARTIFLKRETNETTINNYNTSCLQAWRANMDIQYIVDAYACATYIVSYMSKGCRGMSVLLRQVSKEASEGNQPLIEQMRFIGNKFLNAVEISAQEAAYIALQLALRKSSRTTVYLNTAPPDDRVRLLKSCQEIEDMDDEDTNIDSSNILDRYSKRERALDQTCLAEWAAWYDSRAKKPPKPPTTTDIDGNPPEIDIQQDEDNEDDIPLLHAEEKDQPKKRRTRARILRCPWFSLAKDSEKHFRELIMLFIPWRDEDNDLLAGHKSYHEHYLANQDAILALLEQYSPGRSAVEEAAAAILTMEADLVENTAVAHAAQHDDELCQTEKTKIRDPTFVPHYDIGKDLGANVSGIPNLEELQHNQMGDQEFRETVQLLNPKQRTIFDYVSNAIQNDTEQLLLFLSGGAGVGKTMTTRAIYQQLLRHYGKEAGDDFEFVKVLVMAPTGKAAHLINGSTIHSALSVPFNQLNEDYIPLNISNLNTIRTKLSTVRFIIIDEISMVGNNLFNFINRRLQDVMGRPTPFGGCHVLCVGDLFQLKPVADRWLFLNSKKGNGPLIPNAWRENFKLFELTMIMRQKDDLPFAQLLNRLREGKHTEKDKAYLRKKVITTDFESPNYPHKQVTHLFNRNRDVDAFNESVRVGQAIKIKAMDKITGATNASMEEAHLNKLNTKPIRETGGLATYLTVALEDRIEICINIDIGDGLTNGAAGTVMGLPGTNSQGACTAAGYMWIHFDDTLTGRRARAKAQQKEMYTRDTPRYWTPIGPIKKQLNISQKSQLNAIRIQFPIRCAAAKTIHRSQGQTLQSVVADFCATQGPHKHYVAISRVTNPGSLYITNLNEEMIKTDTDVHTEMERLRTSARLSIPRYMKYFKKCNTTYIVFFNIRSLNKYVMDLAKDYTHKQSLMTCLSETHLNDRTNLDILTQTHPFQTHLKPNTHLQGVGAKHGMSLFSKTPIQNIQYITTTTMEAISADISSPHPMSILSVYRYHKTPMGSFINDLQTALDGCTHTVKYIGGDMNLNFQNKGIAHRLQTKLLDVNGLKQKIHKVTTNQGSLLDHIYTTEEDGKSEVVFTYYSDHNMTRITIPVAVAKPLAKDNQD